MRQDAKRALKISVLLLFFILIGAYALFRSQDLIFGVQIEDVNLSQSESILEISGKAKNATNLEVNGREISVDQEGNFKDTVVLLLGYNVINIRAEDKFGNIDQKNYNLTR